MSDWYTEMRERMAAGANPIELTIEKMALIAKGKLYYADGFSHCPMCIRYMRSATCGSCPIYWADEGCMNTPGGLYERLADHATKVRCFTEDNLPAAAAFARVALQDFIAGEAIPFLQGLREPRWRQIDSNTYEVRIQPQLKLTLAGLSMAIRNIPWKIRRKFHAFSWDGERQYEGVRWGVIHVE